jgi:hypothetical protein
MVNSIVCGRKRSWTILKDYPDIFLEGLRNTIKNLSKNNLRSGRDSNRVPPEYKQINLQICQPNRLFHYYSRLHQENKYTGQPKQFEKCSVIGSELR